MMKIQAEGEWAALYKKRTRVVQGGDTGGSKTTGPVYIDLKFSYVRIKRNLDLKSEGPKPTSCGLPTSLSRASTCGGGTANKQSAQNTLP
jgi:hypothetical protein